MARIAVVFCLLLAVVAAAPKKKKVSKLSGRIIGGSDTVISDMRNVVSLQWKGSHFCGGSIIGFRYILTAAHCVDGGLVSDFSIRAGSSSHEKEGQVIKVSKITVHPNYSPKTIDSDLAVLELDEFLDYNSDVMKTDLAEREPVEGEEVSLAGWGGLKEGESSTKTLQSVKIPVISRKTCQELYENFNDITENMFCAGDMNEGKDACKGDSGGPAMVNGKQAGIVSWGVGCGRENSPGVYTNIAKFQDWIDRQMY